MESTREQAQKDAKYVREYRAWYDALSPRERKKADEMGLSGPDVGYNGNMRGMDISDLQIATDDAPHDMDEAIADPCVMTMEAAGDLLRRLIGEMVAFPRPALTLDCLMILLGLGEPMPTETELAQRHGTTKATVSQRCIALMETFNLPPPPVLKSKRARKSYSTTQKKTHARTINQPFRSRAFAGR